MVGVGVRVRVGVAVYVLVGVGEFVLVGVGVAGSSTVKEMGKVCVMGINMDPLTISPTPIIVMS